MGYTMWHEKFHTTALKGVRNIPDTLENNNYEIYPVRKNIPHFAAPEPRWYSRWVDTSIPESQGR